MEWALSARRLFADVAERIERGHQSVVVCVLVLLSISLAWYNYTAISGAYGSAQRYYDARQASSDALESIFREESTVDGFTSTRDLRYIASFDSAHADFERQFTRLGHDLWNAGLPGAESYLSDIQRINKEWRTMVATPLLTAPADELTQSRQRTGELLFSTIAEDVGTINAGLDASISESSRTARARVILAIVETAFLMTSFGLTVLRMRGASRRRERQHLDAITEANRTLVSAQRVAGVGNWAKDVITGEVTFSDELYRIFGIVKEPASDELLRAFVHPEDAELVSNARSELVRTGRPYRIDHRIVLRSGAVRHVQEQAEFSCDGDGERRRIIGTLLDVTDRKQAESRLAYLAHHDALTGLPNRTLLLERLSHALACAKRYQRSVAVMFLDLDRFKAINDSLGHAVGDALLRAVGERLRAVVRSTDTVARAGGDEFIIVLGDIKSAGDLVGVARALMASFGQPVDIEGERIYVSCSIGVSMYPHDGMDVERLINNADAALYRAKDLGRNKIQYYTADLQEAAQRKMLMESDLRKGLERGEFSLCYQPLVALQSGSILGFEALVRWQHPNRGLVMPNDFIPVAEESGLIVPLGEWVLERACRQQRAWERQGCGKRRVTVNLSARQFQHRDLAATVGRIMAETGIEEGLLGVEITESLLMSDIGASAATLQRLKNMGVDVSIDDFGTGYSSLSYLKHFPVDCLKIDRSFLEDIAGDRHNEAISAAIIALARSLDVRVLAEGVETSDQLRRLRLLGCEEAQGFLFGAPMPPEAAATLLSGNDAWRAQCESA